LPDGGDSNSELSFFFHGLFDQWPGKQNVPLDLRTSLFFWISLRPLFFPFPPVHKNLRPPFSPRPIVSAPLLACSERPLPPSFSRLTTVPFCNLASCSQRPCLTLFFTSPFFFFLGRRSRDGGYCWRKLDDAEGFRTLICGCFSPKKEPFFLSMADDPTSFLMDKGSVFSLPLFFSPIKKYGRVSPFFPKQKKCAITPQIETFPFLLFRVLPLFSMQRE